MNEREAGECFVISPIGDEGSSARGRSDVVLSMLVAPAASRLSLDVIRADRIAEPGSITDQVIRHLIDAELVVADLTDQNPNVFYELAVRQSFGKPVVLVAERGQELPFDLRTERVVFLTLEGPAALASRDFMVDQLEGAMRAALRGHTSPVTRVSYPSAPPAAAANSNELRDLLDEVRASLSTPAFVSELAYLSAEVRFLRQEVSLQHAEVEEDRALRLQAAIRTAHEALAAPLELKALPIVSLLTDCREGVEILGRVQLPDGSLLPPLAFLPQIAEADLMPRWDLRVVNELERVLRTQADPEQLGDYVSVNCSAKSAPAPEMAASLKSLDQLLAAMGKRLVIELSETEIVEFMSNQPAREVLAEFDLAVDDFGTGYSSLSVLRNVNARYLKIDRSFTMPSQSNERNAVLHTLADLGRALGLELIAEGVESAEQARTLRDIGFGSAQGYLFGMPEPIASCST